MWKNSVMHSTKLSYKSNQNVITCTALPSQKLFL